MHCDIVTIFPEMFTDFSKYGVVGRAIKNKLLQLGFFNPRDFADNKHDSIDDRPYGGGPGMVMQYHPLKQAVLKAKSAAGLKTKVIYMSPQGKKVTQQKIEDLASQISIRPIFIAGRYEGVDERFIDAYVDEEWSIGDYVLSGGEVAIMAVLDAMARLIPGTLGHMESKNQDSFASKSGLLDFPSYTRPEVVDGLKVPEVLLSGNHDKIADWRQKQQLFRTWKRRPDLLKNLNLSIDQQNLLKEFMQKVGENHE